MPDATQYYAALREQTARLNTAYPTGCLHIMSVTNLNAGSVGGVVSEVSTRIAAKSICESVARIATPEEIADFHARGAAFAARMATQKFSRQKADSSGVTFTLDRGGR